jgi:hypothetical protein
VTIQKDGHSYNGQVGKVTMIYYDHQHTGGSPDLLYVEMPDGKTIRVLSTEALEHDAVE